MISGLDPDTATLVGLWLNLGRSEVFLDLISQHLLSQAAILSCHASRSTHRLGWKAFVRQVHHIEQVGTPPTTFLSLPSDGLRLSSLTDASSKVGKSKTRESTIAVKMTDSNAQAIFRKSSHLLDPGVRRKKPKTHPPTPTDSQQSTPNAQ